MSRPLYGRAQCAGYTTMHPPLPSLPFPSIPFPFQSPIATKPARHPPTNGPRHHPFQHNIDFFLYFSPPPTPPSCLPLGGPLSTSLGFLSLSLSLSRRHSPLQGMIIPLLAVACFGEERANSPYCFSILSPTRCQPAALIASSGLINRTPAIYQL